MGLLNIYWNISFGIAFSLGIALYLANWGIHDSVAWIIGLIIAASVIISMPMLYVNYKVASNYISKSNKKISILC